MTISDLYKHSEHRREIGHFANIVQIAQVDGTITEDEQKLLDRLAYKLNITKAEYKKIIKHPDYFPIHPPVDYEGRIERLYDLGRMILVDKVVELEEVSLVRKITIGLGFPVDNSEKVVDETIHLIMQHTKLNEFIKAIKQVNKD